MADLLAIIVVDGLVYASWLFLVALGLTLIYGVLRILNMAHGSFYALGAYTAASLITVHFARGYPDAHSYWWLPAAALLVGLLVGVPMERFIVRWGYGRDDVLQLLMTFAVFLILEDLIKVIWGVNAYYAFQPFALLGSVQVGGVFYPTYYLVLLGAACAAGLFVWYMVNRTHFGKLVLAVIQDQSMALAMGIDVTRIRLVTFVLGTALAGLGGALTAPLISVQPGLGVEVIVLAFAVVVTGGLGSLEGAAVGAALVGLARAAAVHLLPEAELFVIYMIMAVVLLVRPRGLFGKTEVRRI
ncbi:MAG TPA: branched-chain amino acid ABC transporter permease [Limnochordales bacterium]